MTLPRWQRAYLIAVCALIGAGGAYAASDWGHWPRLTLLPLSGTWTLAPPPGAVTVTYFGAVLWGLGGLATGALVGAGACRLVRRPLSERALQLVGAWAITALVLAGTYYTWVLWPWG